MNEEEGKQVTVEFLLNHLAVEDGNTQHKFLSQLNSNSSVNMIAYDRRQNRRKSNKAKQPNGRNGAQIKQECRLLHLLLNHLENPQEWKASV